MNGTQTQISQISEGNESHSACKKSPDEGQAPTVCNRLPRDIGQPPPRNIGASRLNSEQTQIERLAVIGLRIVDFSHECRNEIANLEVALELLETLLPKEQDVLELTAIMKSSEIHLRRLLDGVREYAGPVRLDLTEEHISEPWRRAWRSLNPVRGERDAQIKETGDGLGVVTRMDYLRLEQVFRNLFENSLAACSDPVRIEIDCSEATLGPDSAIQIKVRDNGPGLSMKQKQNVFEPFFTSKSNGTGLGMAISKRIVESHGGTMAVGINGVSGAEFIIILPKNGG